MARLCGCARASSERSSVATCSALAINSYGSSGNVTHSPALVILHGRTDVGQLRDHNEDNLLVVRLDDDSRDLSVLKEHALGDRGTLLVVCDGMGGAAAGEVASQLAVDTVAEHMLAGD